LVLALALGLFLFWAYTQHSGLGISPDSVAYLSTAEHLLSGKGGVDFSGQALVLFPLGYPFFLALVLGLLPFATPSILLWTNALLWASYLVGLRKILHEIFPAAWLVRYSVLLVAATSPALLEVFTMVWSETLFLWVTQLFLWAAYQHGKASPSRWQNLWFWVMTVCAAAGLFTRFAGLSLVITGVVFLWRWRNQWLSFLVLAFLPLGLNLLRNHWAAQQLAGVRQMANQSIWDKATEMGVVVQSWFPLSDISPLALGLGGLVLAVLVLVTSLLAAPRPAVSFKLYWAVYTLFLFALSSISRFEPLSNRLLVPAFVPLLILLAMALVKIWEGAKAKGYKWLKPLLVLGMGVWVLRLGVHQYQTQSAVLEGVWYAGIPGYTEDMWRGSALWQFLGSHPLKKEKTVYTNSHEAYYMGTR
ncbi:MAG: hypothetical protein EAZ62_09225, partial [Sphingobacteriia bacterium]